MRGVEDVAYEAGYSLFFCNTDEDLSKEDFGIPVVLADRTLPGQQADSVLVDNISGAYEAVNHLLEGGYEHIACIAGLLTTTTGHQRYVGYCNAPEAAGMVVNGRTLASSATSSPSRSSWPRRSALTPSS